LVCRLPEHSVVVVSPGAVCWIGLLLT